MKKQLFRKGAYVYIEGDEDSDTIYVIDKGVIQLDRYNKNAPMYKKVLKDGEFFGVISSFCKKPRMESAFARTDTIITILPRHEFMSLLSHRPHIAIKVLNYFSNELRAYNELMVALKHKSIEIVTPEEALFSHIQYFYNNGYDEYAYYCCKRYLDVYPNGIFAKKVKAIAAEVKDKVKGPIEPYVQSPYKVYADQQIIFCQDEPGDEMYIIKEGKVKIVKLSSEGEIMLSVLKDGDVFGEMALISDKPRNAAAISWGKSVLLPIKKESLVPVMQRMPAIIELIFRELSHRIWFTYIQLETQLYDKPITRIYSLLENKLIEKGVSLKSNEPVTLNFGIDELFKMLGYVASRMGKTMNLLLSDPNLQFNVGQTVIQKPSQLAARAQYYKSRDHMAIIEKDEEDKVVAKSKKEERKEYDGEWSKEKDETLPEESELSLESDRKIDDELIVASTTDEEQQMLLESDALTVSKSDEPATQRLKIVSEEIEI